MENDAEKRDNVIPKAVTIRKMLPSLALGVFITLTAALFNYLIYDSRLPARAVGNRAFSSSAGEQPRPVYSVLRAIAGLINVSDDFTQEIMYSMRGPGNYPSTLEEIAVVAIDEDSLIRHGAWPWPRSEVAKLVEKVSGASVVALDVLFPEPDRTSLANFVDWF
ncbi:MAG: CHASE2 domain-containing protein, partial [Planctomycetota bacterium]|nr:CHASE2 domain-containing protein [Planctomycetota bacterium]